MTCLNNISLYSTEIKVLTEGGLLEEGSSVSGDTLTTEKIRERAQAIISEVEENRKSSYLSGLKYVLNIGSISRQWRLARDLETVAQDIEERKDDPYGYFLKTVDATMTFAFLTMFSKRGPQYLYRNHYRNHYN